MKRDSRLDFEILRMVQDTDGPYLLHQALFKDYDGDTKNEHDGWNEKQDQHIDLLLRGGFLRYEDKYFDISSHNNAPDDVFVKKYLCLTGAGHDFVENYGLLRTWRNNLSSNIPTIVFGIISALLISWVMYFAGPPK